MKTTYYTATTLDGYIADAHDSLEWLFVQDIDEAGPLNYKAFIADVGAMVMGATTYGWILEHHVDQGEKWSYELPTWVMTHRELRTVAGADVRFASGEVAPVHAAMTEAADGKDLWVVGGGELAADFATAGLLDEIVVCVAPVTLGAGRPLFPRPFDLRLVELAQNGAFTMARYEVASPRLGGHDAP